MIAWAGEFSRLNEARLLMFNGPGRGL